MTAGRKAGAETKSEVVSIRLHPEVRFLAELAARKQRRSLSSFIEWAVQRGLEDTNLELVVTIRREGSKRWVRRIRVTGVLSHTFAYGILRNPDASCDLACTSLIF